MEIIVNFLVTPRSFDQQSVTDNDGVVQEDLVLDKDDILLDEPALDIPSFQNEEFIPEGSLEQLITFVNN